MVLAAGVGHCHKSAMESDHKIGRLYAQSHCCHICGNNRILFVLLQAQAQFSIHAASDQPVPGWQQMQYNNQAVWVSPTVSLTSADILSAQFTTDRNGQRAVG